MGVVSEDAVTRAGLDPREGVALGLMARWAAASRDGDMVGGDFPAWLIEILGAARTIGLADRRGECIYAACPHYHKCFIERTVRRARRAEIVVATDGAVVEPPKWVARKANDNHDEDEDQQDEK